MPTNYSQYQIPQTITMFTVHGEEGANAFPVAPGQKVTLIDADNAVIYVKSTNQFGQSLPLEIYDMVLRKPPVQDIPQVAPAMSKDEIVNEVNSAVKTALQKYFPQINFND
jgi:hypothetical protein